MKLFVESVLDIRTDSLFFKLKDFYKHQDVYLKIEGLNIAGSIKIKPAMHMIEMLEADGTIKPGRNKIIESSSGNLGVALSIVCKAKGYEFMCVTDPNLSSACLKQMKSYGAKIIRIDQKDKNGGYLTTRINTILKMVEEDPNIVWTNQYANTNNVDAHYRTTAPQIHHYFPVLDTLFIGSGTTGTLGGCAKYFKEHSPETKIVAVDSCGSVTFGHPPSRRLLPGLGTSRRPEIASTDNIHEILLIPELETIETANELLNRYALLAGASTATVLTGVKKYIDSNKVSGAVMAICPDFGDRYFDTVYDSAWVQSNYESKVPSLV